MKVVQGFLFMLATVIGLMLVGAFMINTAAAQPRTAPLVSDTSSCTAPCSIGQGLTVTILPPGSTPPPTTPPPTDDSGSGGGDGSGSGGGDDSGSGGGKGGTNADGPNKLPRTGPKETAIAAGIGLLLLQAGLMMSVRTARATPRTEH